MFSFSNFIKKGLLDAVGKMPVYWVTLTATGWHEKGVLDEADLAEISAKIDAQYPTESAEEEEEE